MKAVIPAAGLGTRFLPGTKCVPKELLPVLDRPVIQRVVEEALDVPGVDGVVIVNSPAKPQIERHFSRDEELERELRSRGKEGLAQAVAAAGELPVSFVYQQEALGLGHAVLQAADAVGDEPFLVLLGDYYVPGHVMCRRMAEVSAAHGGASVIAVAPCAPEEVSRYGVISGTCVSGGEGDAPGAVWRVDGMVEKPRVSEAPSRLFAVGRYLLSPAVMRLLASQEPGAGGEVQLTDAMVRLLSQEEMYAVVCDPAEGMDTGTPAAWAASNARAALTDPVFRDAFLEALGDVSTLLGTN